MSCDKERQELVDLMTAYQRGQGNAFQSLYERLRPRLSLYLLHRTLDRTHTEDLLQESFLQLHRSRRTYLPGKPVLPWALAIARHVYLMDRRSSHRRSKHETQAEEALPDVSIPGEFEGVADRETLRRALLEIAPNQREVLLMHYTWGLSFKEIAGVLGIGRSAAKLRSHRGIRQLRRVLGLGKR
jgi:RNA polymerase sigma-70 factor (ECF subfamily)